MSTLVQAALLGVVQGLTEFLPVSSQAHLIVARAFFGFDGEKFGLPFVVALHLGTLLAVVIFFWKDIVSMLLAIPRLFSRRRGQAALATEDDRTAWLIWLIVVGTIPAAVVGLLFNDAIENHLQTPPIAAVTLALGAVGFFIVERIGDNRRDEGSLTLAEAFWIGCAQAAALVPGVSRSGATITVALLLGLRRADAARFIFLMSLPAILGAGVLELPQLAGQGFPSELALVFFCGVASSAIVGYLAIRFFIRYLVHHSLDVFAWYRLALSASIAVWLWRV